MGSSVQERCRAVQEENTKLQKEILKIKEEMQSLDCKNSSLKKQTEVWKCQNKYIHTYFSCSHCTELAVWLYSISVQRVEILFSNNLKIFYIFPYIHVNLNLKLQCLFKKIKINHGHFNDCEIFNIALHWLHRSQQRCLRGRSCFGEIQKREPTMWVLMWIPE